MKPDNFKDAKFRITHGQNQPKMPSLRNHMEI